MTIHLVMASYQRIPRQPPAIHTRKVLLKAAKTAFLLKGLASVTAHDICLAAGVSKGGFYHHFANKESAFLEVTLEELRRGMKLLAFPASDRPQRGAVDALLIDLWAWAPSRPAACRRVRAVHRRTLRQLSRLPHRAGYEIPGRGGREAQATLALFVAVGRLVRRAMAQRSAITERSQGKAAVS